MTHVGRHRFSCSPRHFAVAGLLSLALIGVGTGQVGVEFATSQDAARPTDSPSTEATAPVPDPDGNAFYVGNRPPLLPSPLMKLPIGAIRPEGWIRTQLELQAAGFHGRLTEISRFLVKEDNAWLSPTGDGDHGWEEVPYWLKGYGDTAYLLGDPEMIEETKVWIEGALASQKEDGWFGPDEGRRGVAGRNVGRDDLWPNMIMLFCLQSYYEHTPDSRVLDLMRNYFRWQLTVPEEKFLPPYWQKMRAADNLYSVYWFYNRTGEEWVLELADKIHRNTANWTEGLANWHNVNIAQAFGGPATYYVQSKDPKHLEAAYRNWKEIRELYGQVPGGMFGSDENCRPGFTGPRQAIETCGMVEEMLSDETLLMITGDAVWADRCETVAFDSLPAAFTPELKALRYLTSPNHVVSDASNKRPGVQNGGSMFLMNPHGHRCCQHNSGHGWPYFAEHLFMATAGGGLAAVFYAPSRVTAKVGDGTEVTLTETTDYPFDETVALDVKTASDVKFPLQLRIPGWCAAASITINGEPFPVEAPPATFVTIDRRWRDGDRVVLTLPMEIRVVRWTENHNSASVYRGPLCYSLKIGEKYVQHSGTEEFPAWEIWPTTPWNYGLLLDEDDPASSFQVVKRQMPSGQPFEANAVPVELVASAKRIPNWTLDENHMIGPMQSSPIRSDSPVETVRLIPMGAARLRVSAFPVIGTGPDARQWKKLPGADRRIDVSYCHANDKPSAMCDDVLPTSSNDQGIPRMTWWPHKGTQEWASYTFDDPRTISRSSVYWFDDTGVGQCRVPASWSIEYREGREWKPVDGASRYGVEPDKMHTATFDPVTTRGVRLRAELQPEFSGGVLEWTVE